MWSVDGCGETKNWGDYFDVNSLCSNFARNEKKALTVEAFFISEVKEKRVMTEK